MYPVRPIASDRGPRTRTALRVELKGTDRLTHYFPGFLALMPLAAWVLLSAESPKVREALPMMAAFGIVGCLDIWWQRRALRYRRIRTERTPGENYRSVLAFADRQGWLVTQRQDATYIQALVAPEWPRSHKRRTTVLFQGHDVYVNSIMNPGRFHSPGMFFFGGIAEDISGIASAVARAEARNPE
jgi:hypothetical protein